MTYTYSSAGKGDDPRPFSDYKQYTDNFDDILNMGKDTLGARIERELRRDSTPDTDLPKQKPQ
jgi:hypothetical protein